MSLRTACIIAAGFAVALSLSACGNGESDQTTAAASEPAPAAEAASEPEATAPLARFESEALDDIEMPPPGHFRLVVDGQRFTGEVTGHHGLPPICQADTEYHEVNHVKVFQFAQEFSMDDGRFMKVDMSRMLSRLEASWNRMMGHENDKVEVTLPNNVRSRLLVRRVEPGSASYRVAELGSANAGPHDLPVVRFTHGEHLQATAVGQLYALDEHPDAVSGPFELAVVCP